MYNTIHYCWFGKSELPEDVKEYIKSWGEFGKSFNIKQWDETNFDVYQNPYISEAYERKKYAFVSDYARFKILYENGGLYLDTDIEMLKDLSPICVDGPYMGCEEEPTTKSAKGEVVVSAGVGMYFPPKHPFVKLVLKTYEKTSYEDMHLNGNQETVVTVVTKLLKQHGMKDIKGKQIIGDINIYPMEYFCPLDYYTGKLNITENTYTIHHYSASWLDEREKETHKLATKFIPYLGKSVGYNLAIYFIMFRKLELLNIVRVTYKKVKRRLP